MQSDLGSVAGAGNQMTPVRFVCQVQEYLSWTEKSAGAGALVLTQAPQHLMVGRADLQIELMFFSFY